MMSRASTILINVCEAQTQNLATRLMLLYHISSFFAKISLPLCTRESNLSEHAQKPVIAGLTRYLHAVDCEPCSLLLIPRLKFSLENFNHPGCMGEQFVEDERPAPLERRLRRQDVGMN